jgi:hypothetical protein
MVSLGIENRLLNVKATRGSKVKGSNLTSGFLVRGHFIGDLVGEALGSFTFLAFFGLESKIKGLYFLNWIRRASLNFLLLYRLRSSREWASYTRASSLVIFSLFRFRRSFF